MIEAVLVDDHALFRKGLRDLINESNKATVVGEASDYAQWAEISRTRKYDVLVLDLNLPGRSGMEILNAVTQLNPETRVLILSQHGEEQFGVRAIQAGALGYLRKDADPRTILSAFTTVCSGRPYLSATLNGLLINTVRNNNESSHQRLSQRELQTLVFIARGIARSEIARSLSISPKTVSVYRARIMEKLGLGTNAALTAYAIEHQLL